MWAILSIIAHNILNIYYTTDMTHTRDDTFKTCLVILLYIFSSINQNTNRCYKFEIIFHLLITILNIVF